MGHPTVPVDVTKSFQKWSHQEIWAKTMFFELQRPLEAERPQILCAYLGQMQDPYSQIWCQCVTPLPRYELTSKTSPSPLISIGRSMQTKSKLKNPVPSFCAHLSVDSLCRFWWKLDKICDPWKLLKVFDKIQDGGKSIMTHYDVIGCIGFGLIQRFQRHLACKFRAYGSKVTCVNVLQTLTRWWR